VESYASGSGNTASAPCFDRERAMTLAGGSEDALREITDAFVLQANDLMKDIRDAIASRNAEVLERSAHTIKGSAGVFAANETMEAALALERIGREQRFADAKLAADQLESALKRLVGELQTA
jgi:HPt (histidine-containing phosphotransfer) domain-containing protein